MDPLGLPSGPTFKKKKVFIYFSIFYFNTFVLLYIILFFYFNKF